MIKNLKLILCDIDGTLTHDDDQLPSTYTINTLKKFHDQKVLIGIASGRGVDQVEELIKEYNLGFDIDYIIGLNGAEIYDGILKKYVTFCSLSSDDIKDILTKMISEFKDINPAVYYNNKRYLLHKPDAYLSNHNYDIEDVVVNDIKEFYDLPIVKIMFRLTEEKMAKVWPYAKDLTNGHYYATKTQTTMLEFNHVDAKKSLATQKFCSSHNIDLKDVMAFGDMNNDNDMLEVVGYGIALKNAAESTKKIAYAITEYDNNHDGLAHYLNDNVILK